MFTGWLAGWLAGATWKVIEKERAWRNVEKRSVEKNGKTEGETAKRPYVEWMMAHKGNEFNVRDDVQS